MTIHSPHYVPYKVASATVIEVNRFVKADTANDDSVVRCVANDRSIGVTAQATKDGDTTAISIATLKSGKLEVECGAAVTRGSPIQSNAEGRAVNRTGTNPILGYASHATTAAGQTLKFTPVSG